ncbi:SDR family oxidoreductase [Homoserinimonas sp. A447]
MTADRRALVIGASGFIGRWLVKELLEQGVDVTVAVRDGNDPRPFQQWLVDHHASRPVRTARVDLGALGIGLRDGSLEVDEIFNTSGAYAFGMAAAHAREANVERPARIVEFASRLGSVKRLVHVSGYRVGSRDGEPVPWSDEERSERYARLGAYEASKVEGDAVVRSTAMRLGVPWTVLNPATVIGHSTTGESSQTIGLAATVVELSAGRLRALVGNHRTFLPVVTADYLAAFMALVPRVADAENRSYWVLDDRTPPLPDMLRFLATELNVKPPRLRIPVPLVKLLPPWLSGVGRETLSFLAEDRYPHTEAEDLARRHGLRHPDVHDALSRWARYLSRPAATRT